MRHSYIKTHTVGIYSIGGEGGQLTTQNVTGYIVTLYQLQSVCGVESEVTMNMLKEMWNVKEVVTVYFKAQCEYQPEQTE
jgi:hypothetical protein